jgi:predicted PurR-regulated permease PerM
MSLTPSQIRTLAWAGVALVAWWLLQWLGPVLVPFVVAAVMAYVLHPWVARMQQRKVPTWLGAGVAIAVLMGVLLAVLLLIVPVVTHQWPLLREQIPALLEQLNALWVPLAQQWGIQWSVDMTSARELIAKALSGHGEELFAHLLSSIRIGGSVLLAVVGNLVLMPIVAFYLLLDWPATVQRCQSLIPPRWRVASESFLTDTDAVLGHYLRGQFMVMGLLAVFYALALSLVGLDLALPIGVFTGLAVFVPYLGFGLGLVLAVLAALLQFQSFDMVLWVLAVYGAGQLLESLYLTPRLVGERIGLHPIAVIFALMVFGHALGFVGVLIALPASAVVAVALRRLQAAYKDSSLYDEAAKP